MKRIWDRIKNVFDNQIERDHEHELSSTRQANIAHHESIGRAAWEGLQRVREYATESGAGSFYELDWAYMENVLEGITLLRLSPLEAVQRGIRYTKAEISDYIREVQAEKEMEAHNELLHLLESQYAPETYEEEGLDDTALEYRDRDFEADWRCAQYWAAQDFKKLRAKHPDMNPVQLLALFKEEPVEANC